MARTALVRDVLWRVSVLLQDMVPQFQRWPERETVLWLDDAQMAVWKFLPLSASRIDTIKLKPGTLQSIESIAAADCKPGDGSTPTAAVLGTQFLRMLNNMGADGLTLGKAIRLTSREMMDAQNPDWHTVSRGFVESFMYDPDTPRYFWVTPGNTGYSWARVAYTAQPTKTPNTGTPGSEIYKYDGTNALTISIGDEHVDDIVNYIVARAFMRNSQNAGDSQKVAQFAGLFLQSINSKVAAITGNNPNLQKLPFAPEPIGQAGS